LGNNQVSVNGGTPVTVQAGNGFPNPSNGLLFPYQIRPLIIPSQCPAGKECCNSLTVQSGHNVLNIALADGSVRGLKAGISPATWQAALLPDDGQKPGSDW